MRTPQLLCPKAELEPLPDRPMMSREAILDLWEQEYRKYLTELAERRANGLAGRNHHTYEVYKRLNDLIRSKIPGAQSKCIYVDVRQGPNTEIRQYTGRDYSTHEGYREVRIPERDWNDSAAVYRKRHSEYLRCLTHGVGLSMHFTWAGMNKYSKLTPAENQVMTFGAFDLPADLQLNGRRLDPYFFSYRYETVHSLRPKPKLMHDIFESGGKAAAT